MYWGCATKHTVIFFTMYFVESGQRSHQVQACFITRPLSNTQHHTVKQIHTHTHTIQMACQYYCFKRLDCYFCYCITNLYMVFCIKRPILWIRLKISSIFKAVRILSHKYEIRSTACLMTSET